MNLKNILFFSEETDFKPKGKTILRKWIVKTITAEKFTSLGALNLILCNDDYLLDINQSYLNHDTLTDIITFDNSEGVPDKISGDIFISIDRVIENAAKYNVPFETELHRVIIHGVLHLCGYMDKSTQEKSVMRNKEDHYLSLLTTLQ